MNRTQSPRRKRARNPGRPPTDSDADVRNALLDAASRLFLKNGFERVTARQIAAAAGTTPAMIHYYFTNKLGLFHAMLERALAPVRQLVADSLHDATAPLLDLPMLIGLHMRTVAANPWMVTLIVNEVLAEKGRFRSTFIREIASRVLPMVVELLERARRSGRLRDDLDPRFGALSLLGLCVFPFLSRPITGQVLGLKYEGEELERLIAHNTRLLLSGIANPQAESPI